jgi:hypothetical protein
MTNLTSPILLIPLLAVSAMTALAQAEPAAAVKTEKFDRDPGWEGHNNHIIPKAYPTIAQDFGYSRTQSAGKAAGEIGGQVCRASDAAFYGAKIGPKSLDDKLSASGTFAITKTSSNSGVFFGWFNSSQPGGTGRPVASLGMCMDCEPQGARLAVFVITTQNQVTGKFVTRYERYRTPEERAIKRPTPIKNDGTRYHWQIAYDPAGNGGNGQFQFSIKSDSAQPEEFEGKTVTVDLPAGFKQQGTTFDHFGMMNLLRDGSPMTIHFDDIELDDRTQAFAEDPGWDGLRNRGSYQAKEVGGAQDVGFRPTNNAGGAAAGELGGILWRGPYAYYADRVGPFSLNDRIEVRGRMFFEGAGLDAGVRIGWFNQALKERDDKNPDKAGHFVGVDIGGHTRIGHWFLPMLITAKGDRHFDDKGTLPLLKAGTAYEWSFVYDPAANDNQGQLRVTLGTQSTTLNLKAGAKVQGAVLDRFGISCVGTGGGQVKLSLDDLKYTASPAR